jgi:hypothetical protein
MIGIAADFFISTGARFSAHEFVVTVGNESPHIP